MTDFVRPLADIVEKKCSERTLRYSLAPSFDHNRTMWYRAAELINAGILESPSAFRSYRKMDRKVISHDHFLRA